MSNVTGGSDVSKWQGVVPWSAFSAKESFTFMKATEGALALGTSDAAAIAAGGLDPMYRHNRQQAEAFGLACGFYHFLRTDLGNIPEHEADWFCHILGGLNPGQFVACDAEEPTTSEAIGRFLARVKQYFGVDGFTYSFRDFFPAHNITYAAIKAHGVDSGLWLSAPDGPVPAPPVGGWPFVAIQQRASGVPDGDLFFGTKDQLLAYGKPGLAGASSGKVTPTTPVVVTPPPVGKPLPDPNEGNAPSNVPPPPLPKVKGEPWWVTFLLWLAERLR